MLVDAILPAELRAVPATAAALEASGHAGAWSFEAAHDPFLPLALAAEHTSRIDLGTAIAVAFARNPMTLAQVAWDLQALSGGRLIVGLGTQIKPHITKRFSMPWSEPAARMREFVEAVRAIWDCWRFGTPLRFRGRFYTHTLMTPFFAPPASDLDGIGSPPIVLAAVGPHMTTVAGAVGDGMMCHPLSTERYLREDTLPALRAARAEAGSTLDGFTIAGQLFVVTGATDEARDAAATSVRRQVAFYASTPAYRPVLERHGWGDLQTDLNRLSKAGDWAAMGELVDDELLNTFAVVAAPDTVAPELLRRFGDVMARATLYTPYAIDPDVLATVTAALSAGGAGARNLDRVTSADAGPPAQLASRAKLQKNFTSFGMVPCLLTYDPATDMTTLVSEDDQQHYFSVPLASLGPVSYTRGESRLVFTLDGVKYRLVFQSGGNIFASTAARRLLGASVAGSLVHNNGYSEWFALLRSRGQIS